MSSHSNNNSNTNKQPLSSDNNAEDTSNDVSEIGTISDLTTPEAVGLSIGIAAGEMDSRASTPPQTAQAPPTAVAGSTANGTGSGNGTATGNATAAGSGLGPLSLHTKSSTFDYLYEFSETRKVLEEFFKCPSTDEQPIMENGSDVDSIVSRMKMIVVFTTHNFHRIIFLNFIQSIYIYYFSRTSSTSSTATLSATRRIWPRRKKPKTTRRSTTMPTRKTMRPRMRTSRWNRIVTRTTAHRRLPNPATSIPSALFTVVMDSSRNCRHSSPLSR